MTKIIKKGNTLKQCPECGCIFEYEVSDIKRDLYIQGGLFSPYDLYWEYVHCPQCNKKIKIRLIK